MKEEHRRQDDNKIDELIDKLNDHMETEGKEIKTINDEIAGLKVTVYGDKNKGVKGMNDKVDEIHTILVQAKGVKWVLHSILLIAAVLAVLKGWTK